MLSNGWIVFVFLKADHASVILNSTWRVGLESLVLGRWHAHFDPLKERVTKRHLWVLLPSLPFPLWHKSILEGIANTVGCFVVVDEHFHLSFDKRLARVLVEMDVSHGLSTEVEILCKERLLIQNLD